jgi:hypothetical protein
MSGRLALTEPGTTDRPDMTRQMASLTPGWSYTRLAGRSRRRLRHSGRRCCYPPRRAETGSPATARCVWLLCSMTRNTWPRDRYTGPGGGLSTAPGGGLSTAPGDGASTASGGGLSAAYGGGLSTAYGGGLSAAYGGGLSTAYGGGLSEAIGGGLSTAVGGGLSSAPGGGLYTGPCANPYRSNTPPMHVFIPELRSRGLHRIADRLAKAHQLNV